MSFLTNLRNSNLLPVNTPLAPTNKLQPQQNSSEDTKQPLTIERLRELLNADAQRNYLNDRDTARKAFNGTLIVDPSNGNGSRLERDNRFADTVTYDVYKNSDALSKIADLYDQAKTIEDKLDVIKQGWNDVNASSWDKTPYWFLAFSDWTQLADSRKDDTKKVSNVMRQIIDQSKKVYGSKKI